VLHLVRHGRPLIDRERPAHVWELDRAYAGDVQELRPRLPLGAVWFSSPEPKALATARLLTDEPIEVVADLREHERHTTAWLEDFDAVVRRSFERPELPAYAGWEPLVQTRRRVVAAVEAILDRHPGRDVVLVGHGTAWTVLRSHLTGSPPDLDRWSRLAMPDVAYAADVCRDDMLKP